MTLFYSFLHNEFDRRPRGCVTFFFENEVCPNIKTEIEDKYCKIEFRQGVAVNDVLCDDDDNGVRAFSSAVFTLLSPLLLLLSFSVDDEVLLFVLLLLLLVFLPPTEDS